MNSNVSGATKICRKLKVILIRAVTCDNNQAALFPAVETLLLHSSTRDILKLHTEAFV